FGVSLAVISVIAATAALVFAAPLAVWTPSGSLPPLLFTLLVVVGAVFLFYRRVYRFLPRVRMLTLFGLRAIGLITLGVLLFQPVVGFIKTPTSKPTLSIIVDASGSMSYSDAPNQPNRYRQASIAVQNTLVPRLEKNFQLQIFAYDGKHAT